MAEVHQRCRRLGFPVLIKTNKKISEFDGVTLLWLFYYLLEIYEPLWTHTPTSFTKSNYKPLTNSMRLLELAYKCPKPKEVKKASQHKRSIISSLGAILDKLEAKFGKEKLYRTRFHHPSVKGMQDAKNNKNNKNNKKNNGKLKQSISQQSKPIINKQKDKKIEILKNHSKIPIPTATSYESKKAETEETGACTSRKLQQQKKQPQQEEQKEIELISKDDNKMDIDIDEQNDDDNNDDNDDQMIEIRMDHKEEREILGELSTASKMNNMSNDNGNFCDYKRNELNLNLYNFNKPNYQNETVRFHVQIHENKNELTMTERYEKLKQKEIEKKQNICLMKKEYDKIAKELKKIYNFNAKLFQDTSSTDYALFQLESIKQKLCSEKELKNEKCELMDDNDDDDDELDHLLDELSDKIENFSNYNI